jgi:hypothetical protein
MKLEKKLKELSQRYPDNRYYIDGPNIIRDRSEGRRPHKTQAERRRERREAILAQTA